MAGSRGARAWHLRFSSCRSCCSWDASRSFRNCELQQFNKRPYSGMQPSNVDLHIRNAKTIFNQAVMTN